VADAGRRAGGRGAHIRFCVRLKRAYAQHTLQPVKRRTRETRQVQHVVLTRAWVWARFSFKCKRSASHRRHLRESLKRHVRVTLSHPVPARQTRLERVAQPALHHETQAAQQLEPLGAALRGFAKDLHVRGGVPERAVESLLDVAHEAFCRVAQLVGEGGALKDRRFVFMLGLRACEVL
jgi:hypothetical protein